MVWRMRHQLDRIKRWYIVIKHQLGYHDYGEPYLERYPLYTYDMGDPILKQRCSHYLCHYENVLPFQVCEDEQWLYDELRPYIIRALNKYYHPRTKTDKKIYKKFEERCMSLEMLARKLPASKLGFDCAWGECWTIWYSSRFVDKVHNTTTQCLEEWILRPYGESKGYLTKPTKEKQNAE